MIFLKRLYRSVLVFASVSESMTAFLAHSGLVLIATDDVENLEHGVRCFKRFSDRARGDNFPDFFLVDPEACQYQNPLI